MTSMTPADRLRHCERAAADKRSLGLPLADVRRIDSWLRTTWGIAPPAPPSVWDASLERAAGRALSRRYRALHDEQASYLMTGSAIPQVIETAFYDLIADSRISGIVHSQKRTMILDAGCLLVHLSRMLRIEGRVFDIGCHVGYHASLLAAETGLPVHGIDISTRAIAEATRRAKAAPELTFDSTSLDAPDLRAAFDLAYAVRSLPLTPDTAATVARLLRPGGVAVFLPFEPPDVDHSTIEKIAATGLGFALCDVVGGWEGPGRSFDAGLAAVFLKGCDRPMIGDVAERAQDTWNGHFKAYANSPSTQGDEKTQAYCRGYWQASHSG